jgi:hypothetical protein
MPRLLIRPSLWRWNKNGWWVQWCWWALGGEQVYRRAAGMADREAGKPMRIDALFRLASVSNPILSTAALVLMAQGRLRLEDPVARLAAVVPAAYAGRPATLSERTSSDDPYRRAELPLFPT